VSPAPFSFVGKLPASKSMLNRLLLVKSYFPDLHVSGDSDADDVIKMQQAIGALHAGRDIDAGAAGTVLRFMALRASRVPGRHRIVGSPRLFTRAPEELARILWQLGVQAEFGPDSLILESTGWKVHGDTLLVPSQRSSQFASSVLLNAWDLPFDLYVSLGGGRVSEGYWRMSVQMAQRLGMKIDFWDSDFRVPRGQKPQVFESSAEIDMSSAFALAGVAAVGGHATFVDFPEPSLQPDAAFVDILERMGVPIVRGGHRLKVEKAARLNGVMVNLKSTPDLFPVLAVLCTLAEGESELFGAPHLVHKESDRLARVAELIRAMGRVAEVREDGVKITGPRAQARAEKIVFDCDHDHRLAFAAAVVRQAGFNIEIRHSEVVSKSFPRFWSMLGWPH
jgi:3-phosphoshikimate 1-carboxyvinyltransferase